MSKTKLHEASTVYSSAAQYFTFVTATGAQTTSVEMRYEDENIRLTQKMMATLYDVDVRGWQRGPEDVVDGAALGDENEDVTEEEGSDGED